MKRNLIVWLLLGYAGILMAQQDPVVMRINGTDVRRSELEHARHSGFPSVRNHSGKPDAFVDSFVAFRLKVSAAERAGMDTLPDFRRKQEEYRNRLAKTYMADKKIDNTQLELLYQDMRVSSREMVWVSQIVFHLPQTVSSLRLRATEVRMDSIYQSLKNNSQADFADFVLRFSDRKDTLCFTRSQSLEEFEQVASALEEGEYSKPFFSPQGIHIVKVLKRENTFSPRDVQEELMNRLLRKQSLSDRTGVLVDQLKVEYSYAPSPDGMDELLQKGRTDKTLFSLDGHSYTGKEFRRFAAGYPYGEKQQLDAFVTKSVLDYANSRLEQKYPRFGWELKMYRDSLLAEEITHQEIAGLMQKDKGGLDAYFEAHKSEYKWEVPRFKGIILHGADKKTIKLAKKLVKKFPEDEWKTMLQKALNTADREVLKVEQGVFAEGSNPYVDKLVFKEGGFTPLQSYPFTSTIGRKQKGPDGLEEVREQVLTDYQRDLDARWVKHLRDNAMVEINEEVLKTVNNH